MINPGTEVLYLIDQPGVLAKNSVSTYFRQRRALYPDDFVFNGKGKSEFSILYFKEAVLRKDYFDKGLAVVRTDDLEECI
jgi:hypothetical protein